MSSIRITGVSRSVREMARGSSEEARSATMPGDVPDDSSSACIRTPLEPGSGGTSDQVSCESPRTLDITTPTALAANVTVS
jgi:hypothetical protein